MSGEHEMSQTPPGASRATRTLSIAGTRLLLDGRPFALQGVSFFNALFNPTFNRGDEERRRWLRTFLDNGVNTLRVWCQWDLRPNYPLVDALPDATLYTDDGAVRDEPFARLVALIAAADELSMALEVVLFGVQRRPNLTVPAQERAVGEVARRLRPYRNLILQIWNEDSTEVARHYEAVKREDSDRLVTNSPGGANALGDDAQNRLLDLLTPHTVRYQSERFWEEAPRQIAGLLERYGKPVIDDEPARCGTVQYGGIPGGTRPEQHIEQIRRVRAAGGYHIYHHDMFQSDYGAPVTPPTGIPDPDFSPFHRQVFDYLRDHRQW
jgi:hypothetical protein